MSAPAAAAALFLMWAFSGTAEATQVGRSPETAALLRELSDLQDRNEAACVRLGALARELDGLRAQFATAPGPASAARYAASSKRFEAVYQDARLLENKERSIIGSLQVAGVVGGISQASRRESLADFASETANFSKYELRTGGFRVRREDASDARYRLDAEFQKLVKDYREARSWGRFARRTGAGAAVAVFVAAVALRWARRRAAPPSVPAGNFEFGRLLGRGATGEVFEGWDRTLRRRVALKRLRPELLAEPREAARLLAGARVVASLKHPNIVCLHSVEVEAGQVFLVFEHVDGESLERALGRGRLPYPQARKVLRGAAAGLDAAHAQGVVHRDLKPANVLLTADGEAKVTDFAFASEAKRTLARLTRAASWGTPAYMAPEAELGAVTPAADVWALAVCFYEMLTGEAPFKGPDFLAQKRERLYAPPSTLTAGLPAGTDALFARAFDPEPVRRFATAGALAAAA